MDNWLSPDGWEIDRRPLKTAGDTPTRWSLLQKQVGCPMLHNEHRPQLPCYIHRNNEPCTTNRLLPNAISECALSFLTLLKARIDGHQMFYKGGIHHHHLRETICKKVQETREGLWGVRAKGVRQHPNLLDVHLLFAWFSLDFRGTIQAAFSTLWSCVIFIFDFRWGRVVPVNPDPFWPELL